MADKDLAAGGSIGRAGRIVGAIDADLADVGEELEAGETAGFDGIAEEVLIEIVARGVISGDESDDNPVGAGGCVELEIESAVFAEPLFIPIEHLQPLAI